MVSNQEQSNTFSNIDFEPQGVILRIIQFISIHIRNFKINPYQIDENNIEGSYNNQLSMYLNAHSTVEVFQFQNEYLRKNSRKPDMGIPLKVQVIQSHYDSIFDVECKRLNSKNSHVKQYVSGDTGGIERFKRNLHGTDLLYSAMIGYVEDQTSSYWLKKINTWIKEQNKIDDIFWTIEDYLSETVHDYFRSIHGRVNCQSNSSITLFHFFHYNS